MKINNIKNVIVICVIITTLISLILINNKRQNLIKILKLKNSIKEHEIIVKEKLIILKKQILDHKILEKHVYELKDLYHDKKKINQVKVVVITTQETHKRLRILMGSLHKFHQDIVTIIYGFNVGPKYEQEIKLWNNVIYINVFEEFFYENYVHYNKINFEYWKPILIQDSLNRFEKVF
jgi:hypothetical protein